MDDLIKSEKKLFSSLKNGLQNDYISIDKSFVPKLNSNKLNRFYSEDTSFWFARLKIKDEKTIYYFGLNNEEYETVKPDLILKFNAESSLSPIKFVKDKVAILTKLKHNNLDYAKKLSKNFKISRKEDFYFFILGEIESDDILNNIMLFIETIDYNVDFKNNYLIINDEIPKLDLNNNSPFDVLKNNVQIMKIINYLKTTPLNKELIDLIINYLFVMDKNQNYTVNNKVISYSFSINKYFGFISNYFKDYEQYLDLDVNDAFELFKQNYFKEVSEIDNIFNIQEIFYSDFLDDKDNLFNEYLLLKDSPKIKFHLIPSYGLSDEDLTNIFNNIKKDIDNEIITENDDLDLIIEYYFEQYVSDNNSKEIIKYYNEFVNSDSYNELLNRYPSLNENDLEDIKNKIKIDIKNENLTESDINKRFEIFFSKKYLEVQYTSSLSKEFEDTFKYKRYGLFETEIQEIFEKINNKIKNWHYDWTIFDTDLQETIEYHINQKLEEIRSSTRLKFEEVFPNKKSIRIVLNKLILPEKEYEDLKDIIYKDIFDLKIRSNDVKNELIINYYKFIK